MTKTVSWAQLSATNPCYDAERIERMKLLYKGGYDLKDAAKDFLKPMHQESGQAYEERLKVSALRPYLGKFINIYKSNLFSVELTVHAVQDEKDPKTAGDDTTQDEFYKLFLADCDGHGNSFHEFIKEKVYKSAEVCEYGYVGVDLPVATQSPANRLQEEEMGLDKPYLYEIDPRDIWDWEIDPATGKFLWVKFGYRCVDRPDPFSEWMHYWKVCNFKMVDGVRVWETYKTPLYDEDHDPKETDFFPVSDSGETSFKEIGVFCLDLSEGESLGYVLGPMVEEDYQMTSLENAYTTKACLTIPYVKLRDNIANMPVDNKKGRGLDPRGQFNAKGYMALNAGEGEGDEIGIVETTGTALKFLHLQSEDRKEQMHEIVNQLHSASKQTSSKTGRSAAAMRESRYQMELTLSDRASQVWKLAKDIFTCVSRSRGEDFVWAPKGLCTETPPDPTELQHALGDLSKFSIGSNLADKKLRFKLATGVLGKISPEEQEQIRRDINDAVDKDDNVELYGPMFDAKLQQAINATSQVPAPIGDNPTSADQTGTAALGKPLAASPTSAKGAPPAPKMGPSGQQQLDPGSHLQTGQHVDPMIIYNQLLKDYDPKVLEWVKTAIWSGPVEIDINDISFAGQENWKASKEGPQGQGKVEKFTKILSDKGFTDLNPVILANMPHNNEKYTIIDGRHRVLAAQAAGLPVLAYVAQVGSMDDNTPHMELHGKQKGSNNSS